MKSLIHLALRKTINLIKDKGYSLVNIDSTICLQTPKIMDAIPEMKKKLAREMEIEIENISIKATTTENLGFIGSEEGLASYAVVLITRPY